MLSDLNYDLEIDRIVKEIKQNNAKRVLLQLPGGFKPYAHEVIQEIKQKLGHDKSPIFYIWLNSNFGSCDIPKHLKHHNFDLLVHFGHEKWN